jgi:hypothetical protein
LPLTPASPDHSRYACQLHSRDFCTMDELHGGRSMRGMVYSSVVGPSAAE